VARMRDAAQQIGWSSPEVWIGLIGALLGALISGLATWVATQREIAAERAMRQVERLTDAAAALWSACDLQWEAAQDAGWAIFEMHCEREARRPIPPELETRRVSALRTRSSARSQARSALSRLQLVGAPPQLLAAADALIDCSATYRIEDDGSSKQEAPRADALAMFEAAAGADQPGLPGRKLRRGPSTPDAS